MNCCICFIVLVILFMQSSHLWLWRKLIGILSPCPSPTQATHQMSWTRVLNMATASLITIVYLIRSFRGHPEHIGGKESACNAGDPVWFLGREDPLEKGMATHSSILAWRIPWTEEPGGLQSMGSQRIGHNWTTFTLTPSQNYSIA